MNPLTLFREHLLEFLLLQNCLTIMNDLIAKRGLYDYIVVSDAIALFNANLPYSFLTIV